MLSSTPPSFALASSRSPMNHSELQLANPLMESCAMRLRFLALCSGLAVVAFFTLTASAQSHTAVHSAPTMTPDALFKKVSKSVYIIEAVDMHGDVLFQQSGVAISPHVIASTKAMLGTFANLSTNNHKTVARYRLRQSYRTWNVDNVFIDPQRDVSTFESRALDAQSPQAVKSVLISKDERIYAVSFPKGQDETLTEGTVSGLESTDDATPIRTTISLAAESAGGGLFNANGNLLGLVAFTAQASLNSGIPAGWLQRPRILYSGVESQGRRSDGTEEVMTRASTVSSNIVTFAEAAMMHRDKNYTDNAKHQAVVSAIVGTMLLDKDAPENYITGLCGVGQFQVWKGFAQRLTQS
jgi:hypothetical protein